jgi:hypothetical protein
MGAEKVKGGIFIRALVALIVADARRKGAYGDLYLGSIKLPDDGIRLEDLR